MVSHIVGGGFGVIALATCVVKAFLMGDAYDIVGAFIYGFSMVILYTMSSLYHGLKSELAKKVFQVLDHCTIYSLIAGTYTPIMLCKLAEKYPVNGWVTFGVVWALTALATTLTAIDLEKYKAFSMACYVGIGWSVIFSIGKVYEVLTPGGFWLLLGGGIAYTVGAVIYGMGKKSRLRYIHSVFHIFTVIGSALQALCIILFVL
jgi:hemolysin III